MLVTAINSGNTKCYLIRTNKGHILIDSGISTAESYMIGRLKAYGVHSGEQNFLILTHGHYDHVGNSAILRQEFNFKIALHKDDMELVQNGKNIFPKANTTLGAMIRRISQKQIENIDWMRFTPDIFLEDNENLSYMGIDAKVFHTPGHTQGSICIITKDKELFCGDVFMNMAGPRLSLFADDFEQLRNSAEKIYNESFSIIYPGHGKAFERQRIKF